MIRHGNSSDIPRIIEMSRAFWAETDYDDVFCADTVAAMAQSCIDNKLMSVFDIGGQAVGFACGVAGGLLGNASVKTGTEVAWWVDIGHRGKNNGVALLRHIENLAKIAGVKYWNMVYMQSSMPCVVGDIYESMGYKKTEITYTKRL
jgi:hypothetical protein